MSFSFIKSNILRIVIIIAMFECVVSVCAQNQVIVGGEITDDFLGIPLIDANIMLLKSDSTEIKKVDVLKIQNKEGRIEHSQFYTTVDRDQEYLIHATLEGYEDSWLKFTVSKDAPSQMFVGDISLRKKATRNLDELVVTATKVKMVWKGDTIVYTADAFNLPQGSMLDDLVRQLPGAQLNDDGEIFVNGRKVDELLLGSKSFFRGKSEVLLKNLPYYTVKNIKVYDKSSELSESLGYDVGAKKYVMDVNLKQEYNSGLLGNMEAAAGTSSRYLGRAFVLGFSDPFRFSLVANLNNVNESRHIGQSGNWKPEKMPKSILTTKSIAGEVNYDNKKIEETLNVDYTYTENTLDMRQQSEYFIGHTSPMSFLQTNSVGKNHNLKILNSFKLSKPRTIVDLEFRHRTMNSRSTSSKNQFDDDSLTNNLFDLVRESGHAWEFKGNVSGHFSIDKTKKSYFNYHLEFDRYVEGKDGAKKYEFIIPEADALYNINNFQNRHSKSFVWLTFSTAVKPNISFDVEEQISLCYSRKNDYLFHPDTLMLPSQGDALLAITDFSNSYRSRHVKNTYTTLLRLYRTSMLMPSDIMPYPMDYRAWELSVAAAPAHQSLHYQRGETDTIAKSNALMLQSSIKFTKYLQNKYGKSIDIMLKHNIAPPSLYDCIDYIDNSQPLIVKLGNTDLKGNQNSQIYANFNSRGLYGSLFHIGVSFDYMHRATAQSVIYDTHTGTYIYKPVNVSGNYVANLNVDVTRTLGKKRLWLINNNADLSLNHNVDHAMVMGNTQSGINKVNTLSLHDGMYVQFERNGLNIRAIGDVRWRHTTGKMMDFKTLNAVDFQYGMSARYTIPVIKTTISADGTMFSRRGYGSSSLNTNDFILNASISQPLLKGKFVARLECFDLLHQLSQSQYEVNAQGRIETWYRSLPHYIMLHLAYNFSHSPKKK